RENAEWRSLCTGGRAKRWTESSILPLRAPPRSRPPRLAARRSGFGVMHLENVELLEPAGGAQGNGIALFRLDERARHGRDPADLALKGFCFVDPHDRDTELFSRRVGIQHRGTKKHLVAIRLQGGVDHFGDFEASGQEADTAIDLTQTLLAVKVVAVFGAVAIGGRPGHSLCDLR